jgi:hypothetical protein
VTRSTETGNEDFVVLINEGHTTISWYISGNSLVVLLKLNSNTLSNSGVRLLSFDSDLFNNDTSCVRRASERLLPLGDIVLLLETEIGPQLESSVVSKFTAGIET